MIDVTLELKDGPRAVTTPMLFITNNSWKDEPLPLSRESLDAGHLAIHVAACSGRLSLLLLMLEAMIGRWRHSGLIQTFTAKEVRVTSRKHRMMVSLDGEVTVMNSPLVFKARPKSLWVLMPRRDQDQS